MRHPPWEDDGFAWWAEAFERDHGRPPTVEDYEEFHLAWYLSGEGAVEWTDDDWVAFYYARLAGLEAWLEKGDFSGPMSGQEVLVRVEAHNALLDAVELVGQTEPAVPETESAPSPESEEMTMRVESGVGLNLREAPGTNETVLTRIPEGAEVTVHSDTLVEKDGYLWYPVTYTIPSVSPAPPTAVAPYASPDFPAPLSTVKVTGHEFRDRHPGIDYGFHNGGDNQIYASAGGVVRVATTMRNANGVYGYGNYVIVEYEADSVPQPMRDLPEYTEGDSVYILYAHLADTETGLPGVGTELAQGDVIGIVGNTGNSTNPHLHMEVRIGEGGLAGSRDDYFTRRDEGSLPAIDPTLIFSETVAEPPTWSGWVAGGTVDGTEQYLGNTGEGVDIL